MRLPLTQNCPKYCLSPMALYSASMGPQSSDVFGGNEARTLFIITNPHSARHIQLLAGTKNWYQREVLFPAFAQFAVIDRQVHTTEDGAVDEVWYVIRETAEPLRLYEEDTIEGIGLNHPLPQDFLTDRLVDRRHRQLLESRGRALNLRDLEAAGVELGDDVDSRTINATNIYGEQTHRRWADTMVMDIPRRQLLTEQGLRTIFGRLMGVEEPAWRTREVGWGDDREESYQSWTVEQLAAIDAHGLLYYPTIGRDELEAFKAWLTRTKFGRRLPTPGGNLRKSAYIDVLDATTTVRIPVDANLLFDFRQSQGHVYEVEKQRYEVTHGEPGDVMEDNLRRTLDHHWLGLEQSLALYVNGEIPKQLYVQRFQRRAAALQQDIVSIHPFDDGNGRLSRMLMYRVLMAYYPSDMTLDDLPEIENPGDDLLTSHEAWFQRLFPSAAAISGAEAVGASGRQPAARPYARYQVGPRRLSVFRTAGGGNCGLHAGFGNRDGRIVHAANHVDLRTELTDALIDRPEDFRNLYENQLATLLNELHVAMRAERLTRDQDGLSHHLEAEGIFIGRLSEALDNRAGDLIRRLRENLVNEVVRRIQHADASFDGLRMRMVELVIYSTGERFDTVRGRLLDAIGQPDQQSRIVRAMSSALLQPLISESMDEAIFATNDENMLRQYEAYRGQLAKEGSPYMRFVRANFGGMLRAYANHIRQPGIYLREEDLRALAMICSGH